ncbi:hypothetical protein AMTR_s00005p00268490 [Amborella trichopoda]|uniref:Uncharacterized protein n=1 Tax=Amborella trichopoda TaxID=13333 RepID=W1PIN9_AMBTC|nr:hypothetical protein AMTR_s00005p00268490 [Amborella trichopoda]
MILSNYDPYEGLAIISLLYESLAVPACEGILALVYEDIRSRAHAKGFGTQGEDVWGVFVSVATIDAGISTTYYGHNQSRDTSGLVFRPFCKSMTLGTILDGVAAPNIGANTLNAGLST